MSTIAVMTGNIKTTSRGKKIFAIRWEFEARLGTESPTAFRKNCQIKYAEKKKSGYGNPSDGNEPSFPNRIVNTTIAMKGDTRFQAKPIIVCRCRERRSPATSATTR